MRDKSLQQVFENFTESGLTLGLHIKLKIAIRH
jgi:hypothetical protein